MGFTHGTSMYSDTDFLSVLQEAKQLGNLAIFVGAGISKNVETKLPSWAELIDGLKENIDKNESDYLKIAQLYYLKYGEVKYYQKIKSFFPSSYIKPSQIHASILSIQPNILITTNWDCILEHAIEDGAFIYDVITSDQDLVKSNSPKKLIKMHGDFKSHNIVFKEDDYISYKHNFPLIENYIKSVLSTHIVLFLGYSYNDVNLKQIIKWIQVHSKSRPATYLVSHEENYTQQNYLQNHGITTIVLNKSQENKKGTDWGLYARDLEQFLKQIEDPDFCDSSFGYLGRKLLQLDLVNAALHRNVTKLLNSEYEDEDVHVEYNKDVGPILVLSPDKHKELLNILFKIKKLSNIDEKCKAIEKNQLKNVFVNLSKANITGIKLSQEENGLIRYFIFSEDANISEYQLDTSFNLDTNIRDKTDTDQLLRLSLNYFQLGQFSASINLLHEVIKIASKKRAYFTLFTAVYNSNLILKYTMYYRSKKDDKPKYINLRNLIRQSYSQETFQFDLIRSIFIDNNNLALFLISQESILQQTIANIAIVQSGGISLNTQSLESNAKLLNLINFAERNNLLLSKVDYFNKAVDVLLKIIFLKQKENKSFDRVQLFALIKYIPTKKTEELLWGKTNAKKFILKISVQDKNWLINEVLRNLKYVYLSLNNLESDVYHYVDNLIILLSCIELHNDDFTLIINDLSEMILNGKNLITIYLKINQFIGLQNQLFSNGKSKMLLVNFIKNIINKLIDSSNGLDKFGITQLSNIFTCASVQGEGIFNDQNLITRLVLNFKFESDDLRVYQNGMFFISLYSICDSSCKNIIKQFLLTIIIQEPNNNYIFNLMLIILKLKDVDHSILENLNSTLAESIQTRQFSSTVFTISDQIKYIVENLETNKEVLLGEILDKINEIKRQISMLNKDCSSF